jgi:hypothetical protein
VMPGEGVAAARRPVNGRRAVRSDLRRLEPVEGGDQDTQAGNMALRSHDDRVSEFESRQFPRARRRQIPRSIVKCASASFLWHIRRNMLHHADMIRQIARGRSSRQPIYRQLAEGVEELKARLGGLPTPLEDALREGWIFFPVRSTTE